MVGGLRAADAGARLRLAGWVHRRRDLGGLIFVDLRDRSGLVQISFGPEWTNAEGIAFAQELGSEDVITVEGVVTLRPEKARNPEIATGDVEVRVHTLARLSRAETPAIPVARAPNEELPAEELRLRHRPLDLRRPELQRNLILRHRLALATRRYFDSLGFLEIETPILTKRTPEGARDYLVPSRIHRGEFYALPQSPQLYKQILMVAGLDRYFQIARCFRDEDLRADRQPEFTQIDVEASFVEQDDILGWTEGLMAVLAREAGLEAEPPFPRLRYPDAMERFGSDRPDLRYELEIQDWTRPLAALDFPPLRAAVADGGRIRGIRVTGGARASRRTLDELAETAKTAGAPGLLWVKKNDGQPSGPLARTMTAGSLEALGLADGDLALAVAGTDRVTSPALAAVRLAAARALKLPATRPHAWLWIVEFPLFEVTDGGALAPSNHPFTRPWVEDLERLETDPLSVRSFAYDVVYNGTELGGGSLRIHDAALQRRVLRVLGVGDREIDAKFGFLLEALRSGAPPHGGIALGLDRIVMQFGGAGSLRDVIAFPKTTAARALFERAPSPVTPEELADLHLRRAEDAPGVDLG
ncbi:MAG: aspartate--tRNA ligase [Gemmatimonadetes bacterium]|nr:aspartate--tRNA ligase [Gemmatimonadota bacterium]